VGSNIPPLKYALGSGRLKRVRFSARVFSHAPILGWVCSLFLSVARSSSGGVVSRSDGVLPIVCIVCGCRLTAENRSESPNVCRECLHSLEF